jgi:hypothetical protein
MLDIVRYTRINIEAGDPGAVYPSAAEMAPAANTAFLVDCARKIPRINFVERSSRLIYARMESGRMQWVDRDRLRQILIDAEAEAALLAMVPKLLQQLDQIPQKAATAIPDEVLHHTLGSMD